MSYYTHTYTFTHTHTHQQTDFYREKEREIITGKFNKLMILVTYDNELMNSECLTIITLATSKSLRDERSILDIQ